MFASSKLKVKDLTRELRREHVKAAEMHSDLDQEAREKVMNDFRAGRVDVLVATDIVARGIDIDDISMVVNYDVPHEAEDYVHRIGRTARAGSEWKAATFVNPRDQRKFKIIEDFLGYEVPRGEIPAELGETPAYKPERRQGRDGGGSRRRQGDKGSRSGKGGKGNGQRKDGQRHNASNRNGNKRNNRNRNNNGNQSRNKADNQASNA